MSIKAELLRLLPRNGWIGFGVAALLCFAIPISNSLTPVDSPLHAPDYLVALFGKFLCFAIVAVAMDLLWGYTGVLSLGHGVFFAIGGYCMGMYLMLSIGEAASIAANCRFSGVYGLRRSALFGGVRKSLRLMAVCWCQACSRTLRVRPRLGIRFVLQHHHASVP